MTFYEYNLRMKAYQYKEIDRLQELNYHAWQVARVAPAVDEDKYVIKEFKELFDKEKAIEEIEGTKKREQDKTFSRLRERALRMEEFQKKGG